MFYAGPIVPYGRSPGRGTQRTCCSQSAACFIHLRTDGGTCPICPRGYCQLPITMSTADDAKNPPAAEAAPAPAQPPAAEATTPSDVKAGKARETEEPRESEDADKTGSLTRALTGDYEEEYNEDEDGDFVEEEEDDDDEDEYEE